jgi:hypothetical protein
MYSWQFLMMCRCNTSLAPAAPAGTYLMPVDPGYPVLETDMLYYQCLADPTRTFLPKPVSHEVSTI